MCPDMAWHSIWQMSLPDAIPLADGLCTFEWNNRRELLHLSHLPYCKVGNFDVHQRVFANKHVIGLTCEGM